MSACWVSDGEGLSTKPRQVAPLIPTRPAHHSNTTVTTDVPGTAMTSASPTSKEVALTAITKTAPALSAPMFSRGDPTYSRQSDVSTTRWPAPKGVP